MHLVAQTFTATGGSKPVYTENTSAGFKDIFVFYGMNGAQLTYSSPTSGSTITWYQYKDNPENRTLLSGNQTDNVSILSNIQPDYGYIAVDKIGSEENEYFVWVTDYSLYILDLQGLNILEGNEKCSFLSLEVVGNIPTMEYCAPNGSKANLIREFSVIYQTLEWDAQDSIYNVLNDTVSWNSNFPEKIPAPLLNTVFELQGDQYATYFDIEQSVTSDEYNAIAVDAHAEAIVSPRDNLNEKDRPKTTTSYTGSAPLDIDFIAHATDAVSHYSWEFSSREDFSVLLATYPEEELHYTFDRSGTYYVRLNVSNYNNDCSAIAPSAPFVITVSESFVDAPNYFTPNSSTGTNDEFKVAYKSINKFKCTILNRWGNVIYEYYDPALGWDGRKDGKLVAPGVYFYVIEADGSDGVKHKLKGDINLLYTKTPYEGNTNSNTGN